MGQSERASHKCQPYGSCRVPAARCWVHARTTVLLSKRRCKGAQDLTGCGMEILGARDKFARGLRGPHRPTAVARPSVTPTCPGLVKAICDGTGSTRRSQHICVSLHVCSVLLKGHPVPSGSHRHRNVSAGSLCSGPASHTNPWWPAMSHSHRLSVWEELHTPAPGQSPRKLLKRVACSQ